MLLNTVLTVRAHQANSHRGIGWEEFTDAAIRNSGRAGSPDGIYPLGKTGSDEETDAYQSEAPDTGGAASQPPVCLQRIFRQQAF